jgi:hypothetical protein
VHLIIEKSPIERIADADILYRERTKDITMKRRRKKKKKECIWPSCIAKAKTRMGLCSKHKARFYMDSLLKVSHSAFPYDEMIDLHVDVIEFAKRMEIDIPIAVAWLIAEGLNSYEEKDKK